MKQAENSKETSRKKVLSVITKANSGGAQQYVFDLATKLPPGKFEIIVAYGEAGDLIQALERSNISTISLPSLQRDISIISDVQSLFAIRALFIESRPDIVHLNSSKAAFLGAIAARLAGIDRIIFTVHGWPYLEKRNLLWRTLIAFASWITVLLSSKTICVSSADRHAARWMPFCSGRFAVIHNGVGSFELLSREKARDALFGKDLQTEHRDDIWILTSAELHPNKNILNSMRAVAQHNESSDQKIFYVVMGDGELKEPLAQYIRESAFENCIKLLGYKPESRTYLNGFDVFLLPSIKEGLPYSILEAGYAGIPVVASSVGGIPEIIDSGKSGLLVKPNDSEALRDALRLICRNENMRVDFARELKERVLTLFSVKQMIDETSRLYITP